MIKNKIHLEFDALSQNEAFARVTVAAFATQLDPTLEEISDIKTAVSEGVTNAIIHGYEEKGGTVMIDCAIHDDDVMEISIHDDGIGIEDIEMAREPLYTTKPERDRSGMGFTFMQMFMDGLEVFSEPGKGTTVVMKKAVRKAGGLQEE